MVCSKRFALRFQERQVYKPSVPIKNSPNGNVVSEILFGETFDIISINKDWVCGTNITDSYKGWIEKKDLSIFPNFTHFISSNRSVVLEKPDVKSKYINYLPLGSLVSVSEKIDNWLKIILSEKHDHKYGYISSYHCADKNYIFHDWVFFAEKFLGVPYKWGGRDSMAVDCSALLQLSYRFSGVQLPRDSHDQLDFFKKSPLHSVNKVKNGAVNFKRGDIVYWKGHVAIMIDYKRIIHASGFYGTVVIENLKDVSNRINAIYSKITLKTI